MTPRPDSTSDRSLELVPHISDSTIEINVNGSPRTVRRESTLRDLVLELRLVPQQVAVEVNRRLIPRAEHASHRLQAGDELEVVTLVGGG